MTNNHLSDPNDLRKYFASIPHVIWEKGLTPFEYCLYGFIKKVTGENGGECYYGTREMARKCNMSVGQISKAKKGLTEKGLITLSKKKTRGGEVDLIVPVDIWPENFQWYASAQNANTSDEVSVHLMNTSSESVHETNTESVHQVNERKTIAKEKQAASYSESIEENGQHESSPHDEPQAAAAEFNKELYEQLQRCGVVRKRAEEIAHICFNRTIDQFKQELELARKASHVQRPVGMVAAAWSRGEWFRNPIDEAPKKESDLERLLRENEERRKQYAETFAHVRSPGGMA